MQNYTLEMVKNMSREECTDACWRKLEELDKSINIWESRLSELKMNLAEWRSFIVCGDTDSVKAICKSINRDILKTSDILVNLRRKKMFGEAAIKGAYKDRAENL